METKEERKERKEERKDERKDEKSALTCENLFSMLKNVKYLSKNSASSTFIFFAKIDSLDVSLKISFKNRFPLKNSLEVEEEIYRNIISNLLNNNHTPHLIKYITTIDSCDIKIPDEFSKNIKADRQDMIAEGYIMNNSRITIMEKSAGVTFADFIKNASPTEIMAATIQVIYTILCFENAYMRHNDLHLGNIFVEKSEKERQFLYKIDDNLYSLQTNINVKIYDFDRGSVYHPAVSRNFELDVSYCPDFGECPGVGGKKDLSGFIGSLYIKTVDSNTGGPRSENYTDIVGVLEDVISPEYRNIISKRIYPQLNFRIEGKQIIKENAPDDDDLLSSKKILARLFMSSAINYKNVVKISYNKNKSKNTIYSPPEPRNIIVQYPTSTETHVPLKRDIDNQPLKSDSKEIVSDIKDVYDLLNLKDMYVNYLLEFDFVRYNAEASGVNLFLSYYKKKPMTADQRGRYIMICAFMSLPFWHKLSSMIKYALIMEINPKVPFTDKMMKSYEDDIWNTFNNTLPIKMPIL